MLAYGQRGRAHRGPRRQAVVDQDHCATREIERRPCSAIESLASLELLLFACRHRVDRALRNGKRRSLGIHDTDSAGSDSAHRVFLVSRNSKLANDENVERNVKRLRDLECYGNTAAWQPEHDHVRLAPIGHQTLRKLSSRVVPILEEVHGVCRNAVRRPLLQVLHEPVARELAYALERARLLEQVCRARNDRQIFFASELLIGARVKTDDDIVLAAYDQERGC